ncbi:hypothetical protein WM29_17440 [Burkholderia ubonensis]|nr:hypothetical protein WM29_17440 [Burkholderia ubonensis]
MAMQPDARQTGFPPSTRLQAAGVNFEGKIVGKLLRACPNRLFRFRRCRAVAATSTQSICAARRTLA